MQVKIKPAKVFEVVGRTGRLECLQQIGDAWNDLIELQDADGRKLILQRTRGIIAQTMTELLGDGTSDWTVIAGSPDLLHTLGLPPTNASPASQAEPLSHAEIEQMRASDDCGEAAPEFERIVRLAEQALAAKWRINIKVAK